MKKIYSLFLLIVFICSFTFVEAGIKKSNLELLGKVIYIDPGHGGPDPGTIYKNIYEKDINLEICKKLQAILEEEGSIVYLTRYGDYDLSKSYTGSRKKSDLNNRAKIINDSKADLYISIHLNSISSSFRIKIKYKDKQINNQRVLYLINDTQCLKVRVLKELQIHSREFLLETMIVIEFCFL